VDTKHELLHVSRLVSPSRMQAARWAERKDYLGPDLRRGDILNAGDYGDVLASHYPKKCHPDAGRDPSF